MHKYSSLSCAGWGNRNPDRGLENRRFTTKLTPLSIYNLSGCWELATT